MKGGSKPVKGIRMHLDIGIKEEEQMAPGNAGTCIPGSGGSTPDGQRHDACPEVLGGTAVFLHTSISNDDQLILRVECPMQGFYTGVKSRTSIVDRHYNGNMNHKRNVAAEELAA